MAVQPSYLVLYRLDRILIVLFHIQFISLLLAFLCYLSFCFLSLLASFLTHLCIRRLITLRKITSLCYLYILFCLNCIYLIQLLSIIQILFLKAVLADRIPNKHSNYQNGHKDVREFASLHSYRIPICRLLFFRFDFLYFLFYLSTIH